MRAISSARVRATGVSVRLVSRWYRAGLVAELSRRGGKAAGEIGDAVAVEKVALAVVLRMHQRIGRGHAICKRGRRGDRQIGGTVGVRRRCEVGLARARLRDVQFVSSATSAAPAP